MGGRIVGIELALSLLVVSVKYMESPTTSLTLRDIYFTFWDSLKWSAMSYLLRSASLTNYVDVARSLGIDGYALLRAAGIPRAALVDKDLKIPAASVAGLLAASAKAAGVDDVGLRLAQTREFSNLGALGYAFRMEPTLRRALTALMRYLVLQNEAFNMSIEEQDRFAVIRCEFMGGDIGLREGTELGLGVTYRTLVHLMGGAWAPRAVWFTHAAPANLATHAKVFACRVEFRQEFDGIVCLAADLDAAVPTYDPMLAQFVGQYLDTRLAELETGVVDKVTQQVFALLPSGSCSVEQVANLLDVDRRTMHRHLQKSGKSFSMIVDQVRRELVVRHLGRKELPLSEVAGLLGFGSLSAFSRWFGEQHGMSASAWRKK